MLTSHDAFLTRSMTKEKQWRTKTYVMLLEHVRACSSWRTTIGDTEPAHYPVGIIRSESYSLKVGELTGL